MYEDDVHSWKGLSAAVSDKDVNVLIADDTSTFLPLDEKEHFICYNPRSQDDLEYVSNWMGDFNPAAVNGIEILAQYAPICIAFTGLDPEATVQFQADIHMEIVGRIAQGKTMSHSDINALGWANQSVPIKPPTGTPESNEKSRFMKLLETAAEHAGTGMLNAGIAYLQNRAGGGGRANLHNLITVTDAD